MKKTIALIFILLPTYSFALDGNGLLMFCSANQSTMEYSVCQGYVGAVLDNNYAAKESFNKLMPLEEQKLIPKENRNCIPDGIEINQARLIIIKWYQDHPEMLNIRATDNVIKALRSAFQCLR